MNDVEVSRCQCRAHANSARKEDEWREKQRRTESEPNIIVFVHIECRGMTGHVPIGNLRENGQIPKIVRHSSQIQRDEEFIRVVKNVLFREILRRKR